MSTIARNAKAIFLEAVEAHSPDEWPSFLEKACGDDCELRQRVEGLLQAHQEKGSLFDRADLTPDYQTLEQPGRVIGPWKLRERLGIGGMGVVWAAERKKPIRQKVALKVIKPGMDSETIIARFEAEREALALMNHPNIARVIDAGKTEQGRPYFVMELIQGVPITEYCDTLKLTIRERLELFIQVCRAVQHAHQKGIIHRDIKPSNVLVTEPDGQPIPKVIDFGIAKALHQPLTDRSIYTSVFQALGTLAYMAPEQAKLTARDIDTRADVYGLGVLLYELLTSTTPFDREQLQRSAFDEALRIIREQDVPKPSTKISTLGEKKAAVSISRRSDPTGLSRVIRGDLDCIVLKTLDKDRRQRYDTASALADDVGRFLRGETIKARPPSVSYLASKFIAQHRSAIAVTAAIFLLLVAGAGIATWQAIDKSHLANKLIVSNSKLRKERQTSAERLLRLVREKRERVYVVAMSGDSELTQEAVDDFKATVADEFIRPGWEELVHGIRAFEAGDSVTARQLFVASLNKEQSVGARAMFAHCQALQGDITDFATQVRALLESIPLEPEDFFFLARVLLWSGHPDEARITLDNYTDRFGPPGSRSILERKVRLQVSSFLAQLDGDAEEVSRLAFEWEQLRRLIPLDAMARASVIDSHGWAYRLYKREGKMDDAEVHLRLIERTEATVSVDEGDYRTHAELARFFEEIEDDAKASKHWRKAIDLGMLQNRDVLWYVNYLLRQREYSTALQVTSRDDLSVGFSHARALLGTRGGDIKARKFLHGNVGSLPDHPMFHIFYAAAMYCSGDSDGARDLARASHVRFSQDDVVRELEIHSGLLSILQYLAQQDDNPSELLSQVPKRQLPHALIYVAVRLIESDRGEAKRRLTEAFGSSGTYFVHDVSWTLLKLLEDENWPARTSR